MSVDYPVAARSTAAVRAACGRPLRRVSIRPTHVTGT
jgi:hypothetical protein